MILLLGASGLLGHNVLRVLLERGAQVRVLLRPGSALLPLGLAQEPEIFRGSLLDDDALSTAAAGCGAIVNCAGTTDMRLPRTEDFLPVNRDLPERLCRVLDACGIRTLVHTSTANTVAPGTCEHPTDESAPFAAPFDRSPYACSKQAGEALLLAYAAEHPDRRVVIVNPGFMLGPYDAKPSSATLLLAGWRKPLMAGPRGGKSFLHVRDAATAIANALERGDSGRYLLTGKSLSLKDFYALQAQVCGYRQRFLTLPTVLVRLAGRLGDLLQHLGVRTMLCTHNTDQLLVEEWYDASRARRVLGFPETPVEEAIRDYFSWRGEALFR
ncbi:MAG: NAD-dependent epimerase/dehydratase family protein [Bacteroidales bacterium]|nr:NAD-dependent epimerase/dehydratase family protein [Bacteroidales bacterium]